MAVVIDLCSDSETEESPNKAARNVLESFQPRTQKIGLNGAYRTNAGSIKQPPTEAGSTDRQYVRAKGESGKRRRSDQRGEERRYTPGTPAARGEDEKNGSLDPSTLQQKATSVAQTSEPTLSEKVAQALRQKPAPERLQPDEIAANLDRVRRFNDFHAKESQRRKSGQGAQSVRKPPITNMQDEPQKKALTTHHASAFDSSNADRSSLKVPVLSGAGLAIIDQPSYSEHEVSNGIRHAKRPATSVVTLGSNMPPLKRQRTTEKEHLPETQPSIARSGRRNTPNDVDDVAQQSAQQLETELAASLPSTSPQKSRNTPSAFQPQLPPHHAIAQTPPVASQQSVASASSSGMPFTPADDALLAKLKEVDGLNWDGIHAQFPGRSKGALQVRYSTKVKGRSLGKGPQPNKTSVPRQLRRSLPTAVLENESDATSATYQAPARRKKRGGGASALDGFVSWSQVKHVFDEPEPEPAAADNATTSATESGPMSRQDRVYPTSMSRLLRQRELGSNGGRGWAAFKRSVLDELKEHVLDGYQPTKHFQSTCGDVTCLAWDPDGQRFAAGSIAISDDRSMQYNSGLNLLVGSSQTSSLKELPEHNVPRPAIDAATGNVNGLRAMRESQDPRLFMTVAAVAFSPNGKRLYSAGSDKKVRMYRAEGDIHKTRLRYEMDHPAPVDLLSVSNQGLLATACHSSGDGSVRVYECNKKTFDLKLSLSPSRADSQSALPLFPSALKWGLAAQHSKHLLAGFSSDSIDEARDTAGETAVWDVETGQRMPLSTVTRNVFDVAWNPSPSSASSAFAVASTPGLGKSSRDTRSIVQLYAPNQDGARQVLEWECPAFDINDVLYCPHDVRLIAAGATDGKVYVWDYRFAKRNQKPLHILAHGETLNVLDHRLQREVADTGIRFLSWGGVASRLYSGSSDGVIKVWNPYRSSGNALVKDVATFESAIMSGAFSPDHRDLLIGEDRGRVNLLSIGYQGDEGGTDGVLGGSKPFKLHSTPEPAMSAEFPFAAARELLQSKQIIIRPMGALPIRQAVQGPEYSGPYLVPSPKEWLQAQDAYERAQLAQNEAHIEAHIENVVPSSQISVNENAARDSDNRVKAAQAAMNNLSSRLDASKELDIAASENQRALRAAEKGRLQLEASLDHPAEHCKLECNYLPKDEDSLVGRPDSHRSEQRIPHALRRLPRRPVDIADLDCEALHDCGLAGQCPHCSKPVPGPAMKKHLEMLCAQRCACIRASFNATCKWCSAPVRGGEGTQARKLCERCAFACFRCSQPVSLLPGASSDDATIYCEHCDLAWTPGILGYELVTNVAGKKQSKKREVGRSSQSNVSEDTELLHYHSRWET